MNNKNSNKRRITMKYLKITFTILLLTLSISMLHANTARIGVLLSTGGLNDNSFNDAAYEGVELLRRRHSVKVIEPADISSMKPALRYFCERNKDLIFAVGFFAVDAVEKVSIEYPESNFVLLDAAVDRPNVLSILFDEQQGSFYAGALAALVTETGKVGFIGGMKSPAIATFKSGFTNGARFVNPSVKVLTAYVGDGPEAFMMPETAYRMAQKISEQGCDIVFHAAGKSGLGVINAARRNFFYVIGVDSDQTLLAPGRVIASVVKRIDNAMIKSVNLLMQDRFCGGIWTLGLKDNGTEMTLSRFNKNLFSNDIIKRLNEVEDFLMHRPYPGK